MNFPRGKLSQAEFETIFGNMYLDSRNKKIINYVYNAIDKDRNGSIDFTEAVILMSVLQNGDLIQMLKLVFRMYDLNGNGKINEKEMSEIIESLYDVLSIPKKERRGKNSASFQAKESIKRLDKNGDQQIDINEFIEGFFQNPNVTSSIINFNHLAENLNYLNLIIFK